MCNPFNFQYFNNLQHKIWVLCQKCAKLIQVGGTSGGRFFTFPFDSKKLNPMQR